MTIEPLRFLERPTAGAPEGALVLLHGRGADDLRLPPARARGVRDGWHTEHPLAAVVDPTSLDSGRLEGDLGVQSARDALAEVAYLRKE